MFKQTPTISEFITHRSFLMFFHVFSYTEKEKHRLHLHIQICHELLTASSRRLATIRNIPPPTTINRFLSSISLLSLMSEEQSFRYSPRIRCHLRRPCSDIKLRYIAGSLMEQRICVKFDRKKDKGWGRTKRKGYKVKHVY